MPRLYDAIIYSAYLSTLLIYLALDPTNSLLTAAANSFVVPSAFYCNVSCYTMGITDCTIDNTSGIGDRKKL